MRRGRRSNYEEIIEDDLALFPMPSGETRRKQLSSDIDGPEHEDEPPADADADAAPVDLAMEWRTRGVPTPPLSDAPPPAGPFTQSVDPGQRGPNRGAQYTLFLLAITVGAAGLAFALSQTSGGGSVSSSREAVAGPAAAHLPTARAVSRSVAPRSHGHVRTTEPHKRSRNIRTQKLPRRSSVSTPIAAPRVAPTGAAVMPGVTEVAPSPTPRVNNNSDGGSVIKGARSASARDVESAFGVGK